MTLRNWILAGLGLCIITIAVSVFRYPGPALPLILILGYVSLTVLWYGYAAIRWSQPATLHDQFVLRHGTRWGLVIGGVWTIQMIFENVIIPHSIGAPVGLLLGIVAFFLPFVAGAASAIKTQRILTGLRVGFWSGAISGLIAFIVLAAIGYIIVFVPWLPGAEIPSTNQPYTAAEFEELNVTDAMGGALTHLLILGAILCSLAGVVGGAVGIMFDRTGGPRESSPLL